MLIRLENIQKIYQMAEDVVPVLKGITLDIEEGEYIAIMGPSGSGKSTLMNILGCLDYPSSGNFFLDNENVAVMNTRKLSEIRRSKIGFIFQTFNLITRLSAKENIELPMIYNRTKNKHGKPEQLLELVGLSHRANHYPGQLSGGERQRVAIARALVNDPKIIMADEPTGNLDSRSGEQILQMIKNLHSEKKTILMVTHDRHVAEQAQKIIHIKDGVIHEIEEGRS
ncbi:MAG: macrolide ABC transporter ATP-binding protein [Candidatus Margulisiibacteriota bacterium]|nr:MAG: macrolide ABC transporter ATP-binding protein [Candidatus Margulisbacteria bacterium GWD2_39_127]OGI01330.1 MAG: macrolide ABC transporter ATP-binding protein [Candidatus Margulisbacteria bacterium GWF2_38_17]OGI10794.1 MAG: macrolide ABC transporter ATP-binding protein [Candidatus Margulisbacteria bacterium GWE2_39_32]PZM79398.1 MAG: macrolide ABC transporter ATP-binding protein [Candidatus Margulisiibacteriota bacterium]HAR63552.1 macrolide ABC transporter ATP-binding protein [Candida